MRRIAVAALIGFLAACRPAIANELIIVGTGDGVEMLQAVAEQFQRFDPAVTVKVPPSIGSGGGITAVGSGSAKLARVARVLTEAERSRGLVYEPVARVPSAIYVNPTAGVTQLTSAQLSAIYAGTIVNWKEVGGADQRIRVVRREEADSTLVVLRASMPGWKDLQITERSKMAISTQESVETVRLTEGAIGFGPFSRVLEVGTKVLLIDGLHPSDRRYPSSVEFAYVYKQGELTPEAAKFVAFTKTPDMTSLIRSFGAVPAQD